MMESQCSRGAASSESESESESDFGFAFNNPNFSDRLLRIEIIPDEQALNGNQPDEDTVGEFAANNNDSMDYAAALVPVKTLHISSSILATKSPFFYKLLFYGMSDSEQRDAATLRINASEEAVLMDLLKFMYSNTLNIAAPPAPPALVELLIAADKFEVTSCVRYCSQLLQNLPMTLDSALLYLDLPHTILTTDAVQPLIDAAKQYLVCRYKDITKSKKEAMALPLSGIEAILASDDLQVGSEDVVYDFVLKWARQHYNSLYERMEVLGTRLARLIRFPYMTCQKLEKVLTCIDFRLASKLVREALFFKAEAQQSLGADASLNCGFVERAYKWRPVKVVEFELPREQCVVYMDLKRDEIATLFPFGRVKSQEFHLGGQMFFLFGECSRDNNNPSHHFAMGVGMRSKCLGSIVVDYEFAARSRPAKEEFLRQYKTRKTFTGGTRVGRNLFGVPWSEFMAEDYPFFINGVLHLKAVLTIRG